MALGHARHVHLEAARPKAARSGPPAPGDLASVSS